MGFVGIFLCIGSVSIIIYIIIDAYLGAPQKPRTLLAVLITGLLGGGLIYFDYYYKPEVFYLISYSNRYQFIEKGESQVVNRPIKIKLYRKMYPSFIVLRRTRMYADIYHLDKEIVDSEEFQIEKELEGVSE